MFDNRWITLGMEAFEIVTRLGIWTERKGDISTIISVAGYIHYFVEVCKLVICEICLLDFKFSPYSCRIFNQLSSVLTASPWSSSPVSLSTLFVGRPIKIFISHEFINFGNEVKWSFRWNRKKQIYLEGFAYYSVNFSAFTFVHLPHTDTLI